MGDPAVYLTVISWEFYVCVVAFLRINTHSHTHLNESSNEENIFFIFTSFFPPTC